MKELFEIQQNLKASKDAFNPYGKFNFRSAEQILELVKPLLSKTNTTIVLGDDMVGINDRYYVKATATLYRMDGTEIAHTTAFARETESTSGQICGAQMTGAASSYARKYALCGLFAIDNEKDPDTPEFTAKNSGATAPAPVPKAAPKATAKNGVAMPATNWAGQVQAAKTIKELTAVWNNNQAMQSDAAFFDAVKNRKAAIMAAQK